MTDTAKTESEDDESRRIKGWQSPKASRLSSKFCNLKKLFDNSNRTELGWGGFQKIYDSPEKLL